MLSFGYVLRHFPDENPTPTIYLNNVLVPPCPDRCPYLGMPAETLMCQLWEELQNVTAEATSSAGGGSKDFLAMTM